MDFKTQLLDSSRLIADMVVKDIGADSKRFKELLNVCYKDEYPISMRASRIAYLIILNRPDMIMPYIDEFVQNLFTIKDISNLKNFLAIVWIVNPKLDDKKSGILVDKCFYWLASEQFTPAVKVYSMEILYNISKQFPDIIHELTSSIEDQMPVGSSGFKSRGLKILKKLRKA